jgi:hypothetical protein
MEKCVNIKNIPLIIPGKQLRIFMTENNHNFFNVSPISTSSVLINSAREADENFSLIDVQIMVLGSKEVGSKNSPHSNL